MPPGAGRLDRWLASVLPLSRSRIQGLVRSGQVTVDGARVKVSLSLGGGQQVDVIVPPPPPSTLVRDAIPLDLCYRDDDIIVVDKPAGLVVHPAKGHPRGTLVNALLHYLDAVQDAGAPDPARPGIVHRLDKGTSGVMVVARTPRALTRLAADFAAHDIDRRYLALVKGQLPAASGRIEARLGRHPRDRKRFAVVQSGGRAAVTHWSVRGVARLPIPGARQGGVFSLVECRLETGRTHQVRVHLSSLGHPLLGDPVYRARCVYPLPLRAVMDQLDHQLLHAWHLGFRHPTSGEWLSFCTPPPADYAAALDACGLVLPDGPGRDLASCAMVHKPGVNPTES
ncbi:MAG: RluA family pseudouridine synthase [Oligoflexia bacterium]|nr:RluA family pseudouridine synthase [Oligoflexia bacterium]